VTSFEGSKRLASTNGSGEAGCLTSQSAGFAHRRGSRRSCPTLTRSVRPRSLSILLCCARPGAVRGTGVVFARSCSLGHVVREQEPGG
jgi:hypothetical protein